MTPVHPNVTELQLVVIQAEARASEARQQVMGATESRNPQAARNALDDLHAAIHGDLCDALDRIETGLGMRLFTALHGDVDVAGELAR